MLDVIYEIDGKEYTEIEVIKIYQFWQLRYDVYDIDDAIDYVINDETDKELSHFVKVNSEMIKASCIQHLPFWHDIQKNTLNSFDEAIFDFALQLIEIIYHEKESKLLH
ncbi:MAG: hypothetical protein IJ859_03150 [Synergistaceae bacterium]|nr:hypothetical protein [Synergistaceae bacterium]